MLENAFYLGNVGLGGSILKKLLHRSIVLEENGVFLLKILAKYALLIVLFFVPANRSFAIEPDSMALVLDGRAIARIFVLGPLAPAQKVEKILGNNKSRGENPTTRDDGTTEYQSNASFRSAAVHELNYHLEKMTGTKLTVVVVENADLVSGPAVVLGTLANDLGAFPKAVSPSGEGFRILVDSDRLMIGAEGDLGLRHGVYELLRMLGVDWVMPGEIGEVIPQKNTVTVKKTDISAAPDFQFRRLRYRGFRPRSPEANARFGRWQWRHKGGGPRHPVEATAGHIWQKVLKTYKPEFDADPTMLALVRNVDGALVRSGPQLESTHPRVIEIFADEVITAYRKNVAAGLWTNETPAGFAIGPADGLGYSISSEAYLAGSGRVDPILGAPDQTDQLVLFANRILDIVTKNYPNALVGYYSYSAHANYPVIHKPHPNISQIFAPINFSRFHGVTDPISKSRGVYREVIEKWGDLSDKQGNPLMFRGYNWNLADNLLPYSKAAIWGIDLPFYYENNVIGLNVEATKQWSVLAPSDYLFMRMAWDTTLDWQDVLEEFCQSAYGKGAKPMERYWLNQIETQRSAGMEAGSYHGFPLIYDLEWVREAEIEIHRALELADTQDDRTRIRYVSIGLEFLRLYLEYHAATLEFDFVESAEKFQHILSRWQDAYEENEDLVANEAPRYLQRFLGPFIEKAVKFSVEPYNIVTPLPDELKTAFDPYIQGELMGLNRPEISDQNFVRTRTFSSTWDAQGLSSLRDGAVWYRWSFKLPKDTVDQSIGLFLGGVDDTANVWLNGTKIGADGPAFSKPMAFDLTKALKKNGQNLLAIQVVRNRKANELGLGGIIRPSFLFSGP